MCITDDDGSTVVFLTKPTFLCVRSILVQMLTAMLWDAPGWLIYSVKARF
jgi:hypothetical protein